MGSAHIEQLCLHYNNYVGDYICGTVPQCAFDLLVVSLRRNLQTFLCLQLSANRRQGVYCESISEPG